MKTHKKHIILYYINNDLEDIKEFTANFKSDFIYDIKYTTSVQKFYKMLSDDVVNNNDIKIVLINSYINSDGLNTNTVLELVPLMKHLSKKIKVIVFSDEENFTLNHTKNDLNVSDFVKKQNDFYIIIKALVENYIAEIEALKSNNILKCLFGSLFLSLFAFSVVFLVLWLKK
ncbi:MAG: hypothetical protein LBV69_01925 [Bacteroidales bacterium]|nr:hypothetical protein [Bacteroidales bacterium]